MGKINNKKTAVIIGAGPAGLTAALEILKNTDIQPVIIEASNYVGGLSKTINYKGNRIDIGGHRFFSKSDKVMEWWQEIMPIENILNSEITIKYKGKSKKLKISNTNDSDNVMLIRSRKSRIYYKNKFFDYPISLSPDTLRKLGIIKVSKIGLSYLITKIKINKPEDNLEQFFINRFGNELYLTFFKDYTEKVWGVKCSEISAEWGAQRIKGLSISKTIFHAIKNKSKSLEQKNTETSLIEYFLYPKYGPGQMWELVEKRILNLKGKIIKNSKVTKIDLKTDKSFAVSYKKNKELKKIKADYVISSMPINELIKSLNNVPENVRKIAKELCYRDFITVGLLITNKNKELIKDNWIYIQEPNVKVGRIQIFNNWSPELVKDTKTIWIGMEYFVNENDNFWKKSDKQIKEFAYKELKRLGIFKANKLLDSHIVREKKAYPAYFGSYYEFPTLRKYLDKIDNLFLIGRNGMHKYNNQDHSMLSAIEAVKNIKLNRKNKKNIWSINSEDDYQEVTKK